MLRWRRKTHWKAHAYYEDEGRSLCGTAPDMTETVEAETTADGVPYGAVCAHCDRRVRGLSARLVRRAFRLACTGMIRYTREKPMWMWALRRRRSILRSAAARLGVPFDEYRRRMLDGQKWCTGCRAFHPQEAFGVDRTRSDWLRPLCRVADSQTGIARKRRAA